ncbi:hypothetical protein [Kitasatospora sp. NPDC051914]|uniref:hypothetical protein n=1 Tax=Kitasatospora sp. NPDC051914 TaxID=3154945 RepID=UPI00344AD139
MSTCHPSAHGAAPSAVPQQTPHLPPAPQDFGPAQSLPRLHSLAPAAGFSPPEPRPGRGPLQAQSWACSAAEQASDVLSGLRTVEVPVAALQAALLILTELVARPHETNGMREAAREICGVFAGLTDQAV